MRLKPSFLTLGAIGGLLWYLWPKRSGASQTSGISTIASGWMGTLTGTLTSEGYSKRQGYFWFLISNMETAGFTSNLFVNFHNPFGMMQPRKRATTSIGATASGFAQYASLPAAAKDLTLYLKEFSYPHDFKTLDDQIIFMRGKGYFGDETLDSYRGKVIAWANKYGYPTTYGTA